MCGLILAGFILPLGRYTKHCEDIILMKVGFQARHL